MKDIRKKLEWEQTLVTQMIALYCKKNHKFRDGLCPRCRELAEYARERSRNCPNLESKTFCSNCRSHCYRPDMREKIREVMRFSGPRMIFRRPVASIRHLIITKTEQRKLEQKNHFGDTAG